MAHLCPVRPDECFLSIVCPKYGCLLEKWDKREREQEQAELNRPEVIALAESNRYYEQKRQEAIRDNKIVYKEPPIPITRANAMHTVFEREEFDVLTLLSKRDQQRFERWYKNRRGK